MYVRFTYDREYKIKFNQTVSQFYLVTIVKKSLVQLNFVWGWGQIISLLVDPGKLIVCFRILVLWFRDYDAVFYYYEFNLNFIQSTEEIETDSESD